MPSEPLPSGFGGEIEIHAAGERVGDDERRRREIVGAHERVDAAFEIAIAAEDGDGDEIVFLDGVADGVGQRAAVADASGAAVADEIEVQFVEEDVEAAGGEVVGDDFGAGREAGFDPGLICRPRSTAFFASRPAPSISDGFEVLVQLVMAAMTTAPLHRSKESPLFLTAACFDGASPTTLVNDDFALRQRDAVLRALRAGDGGLDGGEIEFELVGERGIGRRVGAEEALLLAVGFDERDLFVRAAGEAEIRERFGIDGEEAHRRAVFGRHVGDGGAVGNAEARKAGAVELDEFADDAFFAQHLGDGENEVGGGGAFAELAVSRKPTTSGISIELGWPSMAASASMPPTPQPKTPRPLTMVVCESVPTRESGYASNLLPLGIAQTTRARYSRLTWWQMPVSGGTTLKF